MLQQRFLITLFFSLAIFLIKFLLFFVQFSVHFLFFTCFFYYKKNTASFPFFIVSLPLTHLILFLVCFYRWKLPTLVPFQGFKMHKPAKTWRLRGPEPELFTEHTGRWGFDVCVCFVYGLWFFVCLFVWVYVVFFTSLYICNIFVIYNIYTWFLFVSRTVFFCYL